jgi:hypothetical protein
MNSVTTQLSRSSAPTARRTIARYASYDEAERAVDALSDLRFPVGRVAIVGIGLRSVEQVVGRVTTWRAALAGTGQGALIGLFVGLLFSLFFTGPEFFGVLAYAVLGTAVFGGVFGAVAHALQGGRRDFASIGSVFADRVELQVDAEVADEARRLLDLTSSTRAEPDRAPSVG